MTRILFFGVCTLLPILGLAADLPQESKSMSTMTPRQVMGLEVNVKIEPLTDEQTQIGLDANSLKDTIVQTLSEASVAVNESISQPMLVLRIRTIRVGLDVATFFQLSLLEQSMLLRNRALFNASTWSQASLLSCRPEDLKKESLAAVNEMARSFATDFMKAMQPVTL
jgi:hypothetical protein